MHLGSHTVEKRRTRNVRKAVDQLIEHLEQRQLLSTINDLPQNPDTGYSVITQQSGGNIYYVSSSSGSDNNSGTDPNHPFKTIAHARTKVGDGKDDWLLLKRGDTFNEPLGPWGKHGPSPTDPMLISYYGFYTDPVFGTQVYFDQSNFPDDSQGLNLPPRPIVDSGLSDGIQFTTGASNIAVDGIQFFPINATDSTKSYDGTNSTGVTAIRAQVTGHDFLVEDCYIDGFKDNIVIGNPDTPITNFTVRRSEILDSYNHAGAHSQGLYASGSTTNLLIQDNVFDHNGWKVASDKTVFNHDMYINTGAVGTVVEGNVVTRSSLRGTLLRAGGVVEDNFYDFDAVAIQVGNTASVVDGNVILDGDDLPTVPSGVGVDVAFSIPSVQVTNNIIAHDDSAYEFNLSGINLNGGTHQATVTGNIVYDWRRALIAGVSGGGNTIQQNVLEDFDGFHALIDYSGSGSMTLGSNSYYEPTADNSTAFQDGNTRESFNSWVSKHGSDSSSSYGTLMPFVDPNRDMAGYNASLSASGTFNDWINAQRAQTREGSSLYAPWYQTGDSSPSDYTAAAEIQYIKNGFATATNTQNAQVVNIVATDPNASEAGLDPGTFSVTRSGTAAQLLLPLTVSFDLSGSATLNSDYTLNRTTITFPAATGGATTQTLSPPIIVTPIADSISEGDETVKISLRGDSSPVPLYVTGNNPNATITIADATSTVNVQASTATAEVDGLVPGVFTLTRSGSTAAPMAINVLWSGEAVYNTDYTVTSDQPGEFTNPDSSGNATVTFPIGVDTVNLTITPINTGVLHGVDPVTGNPLPGSQDVGLTIEASTGTAYSPGISPGATITIEDPSNSSGDGGDTGGGGSGGLSNPPPLGNGLSEDYIATQDDFIPPSQITSLSDIQTNTSVTPNVIGAIDQIHDNIQSNQYGQVAFSQSDGRVGFDFSNPANGNPHVPSGTHYTAYWTGQIQPSFDDLYTLYMTMDGDASARLWIQDDTGTWHLVEQTNDTDPTQTNYSSQNYFTHMIGDANDDANVNTADFMAMANNFGKTNATWAQGDFNGDGTVNALDFNTLATNFGSTDPRPARHTIQGDVNFFSTGGRYSILVEYSNKSNPASYLRLFWGSFNQSKQEIPLERLYASSIASAPALGATPDLFSSTTVSDPGTTLDNGPGTDMVFGPLAS